VYPAASQRMSSASRTMRFGRDGADATVRSGAAMRSPRLHAPSDKLTGTTKQLQIRTTSHRTVAVFDTIV
jgi:hypothetical protein